MNFERLVLGCIEAKICKQILVGKLLTRSTRFTYFCIAQTSTFQQQLAQNVCYFNSDLSENSFYPAIVAVLILNFDEMFRDNNHIFSPMNGPTTSGALQQRWMEEG